MLDFKASSSTISTSEINGDYRTANFFLCLLTPWFKTDTSRASQNDENILAQEFRQMLKDKVSPQTKLELITDLAEQIQRYFIGKRVYVGQPTVSEMAEFKDNWNKFNQEFYLDDAFMNECAQELTRLTSTGNSLSENFKQVLSKEKERLDDKLMRGFSLNEESDYQDNLIIYFQQNLGQKLAKQVENKLNPLKDMEYFLNYYWPLLSNVEHNDNHEKLLYLNELYLAQGSGKKRAENIKKTLIKVASYKICNLTGNKYVDDATNNELGNLILDRIYNSTDNSNLKFVFNSYEYNWAPLLKDCLKKRFADLTSAQLEKKYRDECEVYFYDLKKPAAALSADNFHKVRLSDDEYKNIQDSIGF